MSMHFRKQSIADSVTERIRAISDSIRTGAPLPPSRGSTVISLNRIDNGDLLVTKTFEHGGSELLTISNSEPPAKSESSEGFTEVTGGSDGAAPEQLSASPESDSIVQSAALGGDSLDALLKP